MNDSASGGSGSQLTAATSGMGTAETEPQTSGTESAPAAGAGAAPSVGEADTAGGAASQGSAADNSPGGDTGRGGDTGPGNGPGGDTASDHGAAGDTPSGNGASAPDHDDCGDAACGSASGNSGDPSLSGTGTGTHDPSDPDAESSSDPDSQAPDAQTPSSPTGEDPQLDPGATPLSFAADIWPVFEMTREPPFVYPGAGTYGSCVVGGVCHGGERPGASLSMPDAQTAYEMLLEVPSRSSLCDGTLRVVAGNPEESCLILFYEGRLQDELDWVDDAEIDLVRRWIAQGAHP